MMKTNKKETVTLTLLSGAVVGSKQLEQTRSRVYTLRKKVNSRLSLLFKLLPNSPKTSTVSRESTLDSTMRMASLSKSLSVFRLKLKRRPR
jgi:hypothetical protein